MARISSGNIKLYKKTGGKNCRLLNYLIKNWCSESTAGHNSQHKPKNGDISGYRKK